MSRESPATIFNPTGTDDLRGSRFTVVYQGRLAHSDAKILSGDVPPGKPITVSLGDAVDENEELRARLATAEQALAAARDRQPVQYTQEAINRAQHARQADLQRFQALPQRREDVVRASKAGSPDWWKHPR